MHVRKRHSECGYIYECFVCAKSVTRRAHVSIRYMSAARPGILISRIPRADVHDALREAFRGAFIDM
eukprot:4277408-Pleurochrysis_carterae.AAC.1